VTVKINDQNSTQPTRGAFVHADMSPLLVILHVNDVEERQPARVTPLRGGLALVLHQVTVIRLCLTPAL